MKQTRFERSELTAGGLASSRRRWRIASSWYNENWRKQTYGHPFQMNSTHTRDRIVGIVWRMRRVCSIAFKGYNGHQNARIGQYFIHLCSSVFLRRLQIPNCKYFGSFVTYILNKYQKYSTFQNIEVGKVSIVNNVWKSSKSLICTIYIIMLLLQFSK